MAFKLDGSQKNATGFRKSLQFIFALVSVKVHWIFFSLMVVIKKRLWVFLWAFEIKLLDVFLEGDQLFSWRMKTFRNLYLCILFITFEDNLSVFWSDISN